MNRLIVAVLCGLLFGAGMVVSDMINPARVLAECEAKRRIIDLAEEASGFDMAVDNDRRVGPRDMVEEPYIGDQILRALAQPYRDHPDWREEWAL
jgi:hypothetical protein